MSKQVFITRPIPAVASDLLRAAGCEVDVYPSDIPPTATELITILQQKPYDALLSLLTDTIDEQIFTAAPKLKLVANYATGYNNIDVAAATKRGIVVTNTPGVSSGSVAEHTLALILALATRTVEGDAFVRRGEFKGWLPLGFFGTDLAGKTLGLIGVGNIGARVAQMASAGFKLNIIYYDVTANATIEQTCQATRCATVEELLARADIVSLHVPLLESTHHLINADRLSLMKPTALLVNTSRGPVIDERALVVALKNKVIQGAGLDVFEFEPTLVPGLVNLPNVVLTPHIASAREQTRNEMARVAAQGIIDFFAGKTPVNQVTGR